MITKVTVVLLVWKRDNLKQILDFYAPYADVKVLVWNNDASRLFFPHNFSNRPGQVTIVNCSDNHKVIARYALAQLAETEAILIQDDDVLLSEEAFNGLLLQWDAYPKRVHGLYGRDWKHDHTYAEFFDHDNIDVPIVLGRTMLFHRKYLTAWMDIWRSALVQDIRNKYPKDMTTHGDDIILSWIVMTESGKLNRVYDYPRTELPHTAPIHGHPEHFNYRQELMQALWNLPKA